MPYALILAGLILTVAGARNTQGQLFTLIKNDFTGNGSFVWWSVSIVGIGAIGYVKDLRSLANTFLALVLIVLVLNTNSKGQNAFTNFLNALRNVGNSSPQPDQTKPTGMQNNSLLQGAANLVQGAQSLAANIGGQ